MTPGTIRLTTPITGLFRVAYTRRSGTLPQNATIDLIPFRRVTPPGEQVISLDSLGLATEAFREFADVTAEEQWFRAAASANYTIENLSISRPIYLFRKESDLAVLSGTGVRIVSQHLERVVTILRIQNGLLMLYCPPGSHNGVVELQQVEITPAIAPDSTFTVEAGSNVAATLAIVMQVNEARWTAAIATPGTVVNQALCGADFVQWLDTTEWNPEDASETFQQDQGIATQVRQNVLLGDLHPVVATFNLAPNLGIAGARLLGQFGTAPTRICYAASASLRLRVEDATGWFWETPLLTTGGQFLERSFDWSDFTLSILQENSGVLPVAPANGAIKQYQIIATQEAIVVSVYYVGAPPTRLNANIIPTRFAIITLAAIAHTVSVGNVVLGSAPLPPYPILPREMVAASETNFRGNFLTWQQPSGDSGIHQFWADSQADYAAETGIVGPFRLGYRWAIGGLPGFIDHDDLYDLSWGGWQAKTGALACRAWYETEGEIVRQVALNWVNFLDRQWQNRDGVILTPFTPLPVQEPNSFNSPIVAWYLEAGLFANLAGGDRVVTFRVLQKSLDLLFRQTNYETLIPPDQGGEGAIVIFHAIARLLRYQHQIRYPTPSEMGDTESDFAAKIVKVMGFNPSLNLPTRAAYGFRYQVPVLLDP